MVFSLCVVTLSGYVSLYADDTPVYLIQLYSHVLHCWLAYIHTLSNSEKLSGCHHAPQIIYFGVFLQAQLPTKTSDLSSQCALASQH